MSEHKQSTPPLLMLHKLALIFFCIYYLNNISGFLVIYAELILNGDTQIALDTFSKSYLPFLAALLIFIIFLNIFKNRQANYFWVRSALCLWFVSYFSLWFKIFWEEGFLFLIDHIVLFFDKTDVHWIGSRIFLFYITIYFHRSKSVRNAPI